MLLRYMLYTTPSLVLTRRAVGTHRARYCPTTKGYLTSDVTKAGATKHNVEDSAAITLVPLVSTAHENPSVVPEFVQLAPRIRRSAKI